MEWIEKESASSAFLNERERVILTMNKIRMTPSEILNRRDFLKGAGAIAGGLAMGSIPIINSGCKGGPTDPDTPGNTVNVEISFYSSIRGNLNYKMTKSGFSGDTFSFNIGDLGFTGIDPNRIALRKATGLGELVGSLVHFSNSGSASLKFPESDEAWEAYVFDSADYSLVEEGPRGYVLFREFNWKRVDEDVTGPDAPILEAISQLTNVVDKPWKKIGTFSKNDTANISIGYSTERSVKPVMFADGSIDGKPFVYLDPEYCQTDAEKLKYFLRGCFSVNTKTKIKLADGRETQDVICDQQTGDLNPLGQRLFAYAYLRGA